MISVESHSKQIKLLNDYILALERQVNAAKKEAEQIQKNSKQGGEDIKKITDELSKAKTQNQQLKAHAARLTQEVNRFNGLEKEFFALRDYLDREVSEKNHLILNIQEVTANNKTIYDRMQELQAETASLKNQIETERKKWAEEAESSKVLMQQKDKKCEDLSFLLAQEKKNNGLRVTSLQSSTNNLLRIKNQEISRLSKQVDEAKQQLASAFSQSTNNKSILNETIKDLNTKITESKFEIERLQKENGELKSLLERKQNDLTLLSNTLNAKAKEYDAYIKRSNEEKTNLLRIVRGLEDEKKNLEIANASFKGDASETNRALSANIKKVQQLSLKLQTSQNELTSLRSAKADADILVINLKKELQSNYNLYDKANRQKEEALERESEVLRQKFNGDAFYNEEINKKQYEIQKLNQQIQQLNSLLKGKGKSIVSLQEELKDLKSQYASFRSQSTNLSDSHSQELEQIRNKMKESERRNQMNLQKIQAMSLELKDLQGKFQAERNSLELAKKELERVRETYNKEVADLSSDYEAKLKKKNEEIAQASLQKQEVIRKLKNLEDSFSASRDEISKNQKALRESVKRLQIERDSYLQKLNTINLSSLIDNQSRAMKESEIESLRKGLSLLEVNIKEQRSTIQLLTRGLAEKEKQIEGLQASNAALRKQIISSISNQEASKRELMDVKSKAGSVFSNSRVRSSYFDSLRTSGVEEPRIPKSVRISTATNIVRSGSGDKRSFNKKRTTPSQPRSSMIEEIGGMDEEPIQQEQIETLLD